MTPTTSVPLAVVSAPNALFPRCGLLCRSCELCSLEREVVFVGARVRRRTKKREKWDSKLVGRLRVPLNARFNGITHRPRSFPMLLWSIDEETMNYLVLAFITIGLWFFRNR